MRALANISRCLQISNLFVWVHHDVCVTVKSKISMNNQYEFCAILHNACHSYRHMYMCEHVLVYAAYTCVPCVKLRHAFGNSWNVHTSGSGVYELALYLLNSYVCFNCVFFLSFSSLVDFFKLVVIIFFVLCNVVAIRLQVASKLWIFLWYKQFLFG